MSRPPVILYAYGVKRTSLLLDLGPVQAGITRDLNAARNLTWGADCVNPKAKGTDVVNRCWASPFGDAGCIASGRVEYAEVRPIQVSYGGKPLQKDEAMSDSLREFVAHRSPSRRRAFSALPPPVIIIQLPDLRDVDPADLRLPPSRL